MKSVRSKMLVIRLEESAMWGGTPLHEALLLRLRQSGALNAAAERGVSIYGPGGDGRSITITAIEAEEKLWDIIQSMKAMAPHALIVLLDAEVVSAA